MSDIYNGAKLVILLAMVAILVVLGTVERVIRNVVNR